LHAKSRLIVDKDDKNDDIQMNLSKNERLILDTIHLRPRGTTVPEIQEDVLKSGIRRSMALIYTICERLVRLDIVDTEIRETRNALGCLRPARYYWAPPNGHREAVRTQPEEREVPVGPRLRPQEKNVLA
jgi:hypothetical protein